MGKQAGVTVPSNKKACASMRCAFGRLVRLALRGRGDGDPSAAMKNAVVRDDERSR
jgi:hypothetical protein